MTILEIIGLVVLITLSLIVIIVAAGLSAGLVYNDWIKPLFRFGFKKGKNIKPLKIDWKHFFSGYILYAVGMIIGYITYPHSGYDILRFIFYSIMFFCGYLIASRN